MTIWRIIYAGIDTNILQCLLDNKESNVIGLARLEFLSRHTWNPVNWLFQIVYFLRRRNSCRHLETPLAFLVVCMAGLLSGHWRRYASYLYVLSRNRIPIYEISPGSVDIAVLRRLAPDILVLNVWEIVPQKVLACFKRGAINIHPSKLPKYRGALPTLWSIRNGDRESAVSFVTVDNKIDGGQILRQVPFNIEDQDDWRSIENKVDVIVRQNVGDVITEFLSGQSPENGQPAQGGSLTAKYADYQRIDLSTESTREIANKVPYYPYWDPGTLCFVDVAERPIRLKRVKLLPEMSAANDPLVAGCYLHFPRMILRCRNGVVAARLFIDVPFTDSVAAICHLSAPWWRRGRGVAMASRVGELTLGHAVNLITIYAFEYGLYPLVIFWLGLLHGFAVMAVLSFVLSFLTIKFYDWSKHDWLGIEAIKSLKNYEGKRLTTRWFAWALRKSDPVACVLLSIQYDPFIVTVYLRRGRFGGMIARDWRIFLLSWIIGNVWWSIVCFSGISAVEWVWKFIKGLIN